MCVCVGAHTVRPLAMTPDHEPGSRVIHKAQRSARPAETENSVHCFCSGCMKWAPPRRSGRGRGRCRCRCSCSCTLHLLAAAVPVAVSDIGDAE